MSAQIIATILHKMQYPINIIDLDAQKKMKKDGILVVHAASDDLVILNGYFDEEYDVLDGSVFINKQSSCVLDKETAENNFFTEGLSKITPIFDGKWRFETDIPHEKFSIMEDGEVFIEGLVIDMNQAFPNTLIVENCESHTKRKRPYTLINDLEIQKKLEDMAKLYEGDEKELLATALGVYENFLKLWKSKGMPIAASVGFMVDQNEK